MIDYFVNEMNFLPAEKIRAYGNIVNKIRLIRFRSETDISYLLYMC